MTKHPCRLGRTKPSPLLLAAVAAALLLAGTLGGRGLGILVRDGLDRIVPGARTIRPAEGRTAGPFLGRATFRQPTTWRASPDPSQERFEPSGVSPTV